MKVIHVFRWNLAIRYLWEKVKFFCLLFCCILKKVAKFCFYRKRKRIGTKTNFVILVLDTIVWMTLTEISLHVNFLHKRTLYLIYSFYPTTHFTPPYPIYQTRTNNFVFHFHLPSVLLMRMWWKIKESSERVLKILWVKLLELCFIFHPRSP